MITFPDISPIIVEFDIGGFNLAIRWYAVSYILGFIVAGVLMKFFVARSYLYGTERPR